MSNIHLPLSLLREGDRAEVMGIDGPQEIVGRILERGVRVGTVIEMIKPGNPAVLRVGESKLSLRFDDAVEITVRLTE